MPPNNIDILTVYLKIKLVNYQVNIKININIPDQACHPGYIIKDEY